MAEKKNLLTYELHAKALEDQLPFVFTMLKEILTKSNLEDEKRLYEIIAQMKSRLQMVLPSHGHSTAVTRVSSYFSETSDYSDRTGGIAFYRVIEKLEHNFHEEKDRKDAKIEELNDRLVRNMAEFDNFRKRSEKEKAQMFEIGAKSIIEKILPVIDNFERGLGTVSEEEKESAFVQGIEQI